jgi:hypothetical protein
MKKDIDIEKVSATKIMKRIRGWIYINGRYGRTR